MQRIKHKAVNWIDGMKISKEHLIQQEFFFIDCLKDATAANLNRLNYGLLAPDRDDASSINVKITVDPVKIIRVNVVECHAVTSSGERIDISAGDMPGQSADIDKLTASYDYSESKETNFYVVVSVDLYARNPVGKTAGDEIPPRYPYVTPAYSVAVLPETQIKRDMNSVLIVGKLKLNAGRMQVVDKYIPPSTMVKNHPLLQETYYLLGNQLGETANLNLAIVQKIHAKSQSTSLVRSFMEFSEKVSDFLAENLGRFMLMIAELPPVTVIENFMRFAYVIKFSLERLPSKDKEEFMIYLSEWTELSVSDINEKILEMIRTEYNHDDIAVSLKTTEEFMSMVHLIFTKLNALDFIGKKKGERAFVQERSYTEEKEETNKQKEKKKGWSFLAD